MANVLAKVASAARSLFTKASPAGVNAGRLMYNFGPYYGGGGYTPHEPFSGAWQKNVANAGARDPSILAFSGVYACVTIISQDIAKLAMRVIVLGDDGVSEKIAKDSPYHRVLRKPNKYQTAVDFVQLFVTCRLLRGNAYVFKELDNRGVPRALHLLHPDRVQVLIEPNSKEVFYQYNPWNNDMANFSDFATNEGSIVIPSRYIIHDRINCLYHPLLGTSPLMAAAVTAMTGARILMNSESLFANMARPAGILTAPGTVTDVTAERLKRDFEANYSKGNIGKTAVLGDGLEWKAMVMTSTDAQLIEQLKWTIEDVARAFRVPMYLLADLTRATHKNAEQAAQSYFSGCLQYHIEAIEARFTMDFDLDENVQYVAFNVRTMFRMDITERFSAYKEGIASGVLSPNEAREWEQLGPKKGGDEPRMQMQYVPLSTPTEMLLNGGDKAKPAPTPAPAPADAPAPAPAPAAGKSADTDADDGEDSGERHEGGYSTESRGEMLQLMRRVSTAAARAQFAFEERNYE